MLRPLLSRLLPLFESGGTDENGDGPERRVRPSRLDASVRYAHGMDVDRLETEIADIEERARDLETARRDG